MQKMDIRSSTLFFSENRVSGNGIHRFFIGRGNLISTYKVASATDGKEIQNVSWNLHMNVTIHHRLRDNLLHHPRPFTLG
jgi:hypothetical protein